MEPIADLHRMYRRSFRTNIENNEDFSFTLTYFTYLLYGTTALEEL